MKLDLATYFLTETRKLKGIKVKHSKDDQNQPNREKEKSGTKKRERKAAIY